MLAMILGPKVPTPFSSFYPQKLSNDGKSVFALTQLSEDINASQVLIKMAVETGDYEVIHDFGFVSELSISFSAEGGELEYATWVDDKPEIKIFNKSKESSILAGFMKSFDSFNVSVTSIDDNNENIMLHVELTWHPRGVLHLGAINQTSSLYSKRP